MLYVKHFMHVHFVRGRTDRNIIYVYTEECIELSRVGLPQLTMFI